jgi:hypothetical protein
VAVANPEEAVGHLEGEKLPIQWRSKLCRHGVGATFDEDIDPLLCRIREMNSRRNLS